MRKALTYCAAGLGVHLLASAAAQEQATFPRSTEQRETDIRSTPEIGKASHLPRRALIQEIQDWLCDEFELPRVEDYPNIALVPTSKIMSLRRASLRKDATELLVDGERDTIAVYEDATRTIYLPESWSGSTVVEQSILVHELVHDIQNVLGLQFECAQAREKLAYLVQDRWLARSGHSLAADFQLDPFTLLLSTTCPYLN
jgi:hypothetical protein